MEKKGYMDGIAGNLELMEKFYPGWVMRLYFDLDGEKDLNSSVNPLLKGDKDLKSINKACPWLRYAASWLSLSADSRNLGQTFFWDSVQTAK